MLPKEIHLIVYNQCWTWISHLNYCKVEESVRLFSTVVRKQTESRDNFPQIFGYFIQPKIFAFLCSVQNGSCAFEMWHYSGIYRFIVQLSNS